MPIALSSLDVVTCLEIGCRCRTKPTLKRYLEIAIESAEGLNLSSAEKFCITSIATLSLCTDISLLHLHKSNKFIEFCNTL